MPGVSQIAVRSITPAEHLAFVRRQPSASFLQTPAWGRVKTDWSHESVGWYDADQLVGAGLVLYRRLPAVARSLAYLPEGPLLDWSSPALPEMLAALAAHLGRKRAFGVRIGPPVVTRSWAADTVKKAIADSECRRRDEVPAGLPQRCRRPGHADAASGRLEASGRR